MEHSDAAERKEAAQEACCCPFCDNTLTMPFSFCQACGAQIVYCEDCGQPLPQGAETCPNCAEKK